MSHDKQSLANIVELMGGHQLLSKLSAKDRRRLAKKLEPVALDSVKPLYISNGAIREVFFPLSAILFFVGTTSEGHVVEVGQIGSEGIAGVEVAMRTNFADMSLMTLAIQIPGTALRMKAKDFAEEVDRHLEVNRCVRRYIGFFLGQMQLLIACNRHHTVEQRGARWLLLLQDRTGSRDLWLTQQHLADMLGVTRQSADRLLGEFESAGILENRRGIVTIKNRSTLVSRACHCYRMLAERLEGVFAA